MRGTRRVWPTLVGLFVMLAGLPLASPAAVAAASSDLFFSEYIEGSSNNKALEIYNGTGATVDLAAGGYDVQMCFNGNSSCTLTISLSGTVAAGDVFVLAHSSAAAAILAVADQTNGAGWFNGDDAILLRHAGSVIDSIGQLGFDPGSQWGSGDESTADNTLRRKAAITDGDTNSGDAFDPSIEWDGFATDTFDGLGTHGDSTGGVADVIINELDSDTPSTDVLEFVELFGTPNASLDGLTVVFFNGSNDQVYDAFDLDGYSTDGDGYFLLGNSGVSPTPSITFGSNGLQNGADAVALYAADSSDLPSGTLVTTTDLIDAVVYDTSDADDAGLLTLLNPGQPQVNEDAGGDGASNSIGRCPNGSGGARNTDTFMARTPTPGAENNCPTENPGPGACGEAFTPVYAIQGSGAASPLAGSAVETEGVVVGAFEGPSTVGIGGFFIQDAAGDGDAATSDGVFVFSGGSPAGVSVGDSVRVSATVSEFNGLTELTDVTVQICGTAGVPAPVDVTLPFATLDFPERYEGMLVRLPQSLVISEYFDYDRFGELVLAKPLDGEDRPYTPTAVDEPGPDAVARAAANLLSRITLDDGLGVQNPSVTRHPNGEPFSLSNTFRGGDLVTNTLGVLTWDFGKYRIQPTGPADYTAVNPRPATPDGVGGRLTVASMNTLNFFVTLDDHGDVCGPAQDVECRGADDADEFARQRAKLIDALVGLDADVIGLNELENTTGVEPLADIVAGLNAELGAGTYAYIDTGTIGSDAIKVGLIYRTAAVTPVADFALLDSSVDPRFNDAKNRPTLAQTFAENASGQRFTIAVNHLKSKGSDCDEIGDPDTGDGQGNCAVTREQAAQALVDWLAGDPTASGDPDFLIVGDLNSYAREDSIDAVKAGADDVAGTGDDYTNLIDAFIGDAAYSYVFDGQFGYLDHALASSSLAGQVSGAGEWHINADEPDLLDYDTTFKSDAQDALYEPIGYRTSDHDPVLVGLELAAGQGKLTGGGKFDGGQISINTNGPSHFTLPGGTKLTSTGYDWMTFSGSTAVIQGTATDKHSNAYSFRLLAYDGGSPGSKDRVRLVAWDADGELVYDSQPGDPLSAAPSRPLDNGNLVVHN